MEKDGGDALWGALQGVMPYAQDIDAKYRPALYALVRRSLFYEQEEESEALNIYPSHDLEALRSLIQSLPYYTPDEIITKIQEMNFSSEHAELELSHWAFRHQAVTGELMTHDHLNRFKLIRFQPQAYLLMVLNAPADILAGFIEAFTKPPDVFSGQALYVEDQAWSGWAWFNGPSEEINQKEAQRLRELWKGNTH